MENYLKNKISEMYLSNNDLYSYPLGFSFLFTRLAGNHNSLICVFYLKTI